MQSGKRTRAQWPWRAAGGVQTKVSNKANSLRWDEQSGSGYEVASIPYLDGIPDGGIEVGGVAHRPLGRQVGELVHGEGGTGDVLSECNARFVIVAVYANFIVD